MVRNKKIRACIFWIIIVLSISGCESISGQNQSDIGGKHFIAVIAKSSTSTFWKSVIAGANAAGTEYNLMLSVTAPDKEEDYELQNQLIREAVAEGAEAIVYSAVDFNGNAQAIEEAAAKGVKIVVIDSDVNSNAVNYRISSDNYEAGKLAGEEVLNCKTEKINIGIVNYDINSANGQQREQGLRECIEEDERVTIIKTINVISTTEDAREGTIKLLKEHPEINVIATFNEWTSLGVGWAIRSLELENRVKVVAFDSNVVSVGMLETGEVDALIVQNPYAMGYLGVECAYNLIQGNTSSKKQMETSLTLVTKQNMYTKESQKILFPLN